MQILAGVLILVGFVAAVVALGTLIYILPYARPKDHKNPDWMVVLLRSYKPQIIAYFVLLAVAGVALGLASFLLKHPS
jgi:hypothetical protein